MCDKVVNRCFLYLVLFLIDINWELCGRVVSEDSFSIRYVPDQYKTQKMFDKAVDDSLAALKLIPNWFVTSKMVKELFTALYTDETILYFNEDSGNVMFSSNEMGILNIGLNNINLDNNFDEDDPDTIIHIWILAWHITTLNLKNARHLKKDKWRINANSLAS